MDSAEMNLDFEDLLGGTVSQPVDIWPETAATAEIADLLGVSLRTIGELTQKGILPKAARGRYPVRDAVRAYAAHLREQAAGRTGSTTLTAERIRVATAQAEKLELANAVARGEMVPSRQIHTEWAGILRDVRACLLAVSSRCGASLPHLTTHDVATIDTEIRVALEALADEA